MMWEDVETIRVPANGLQFEVMRTGKGHRLALCLHGFPEHAYSWRHQMPLLAKLGYVVWAPNLRGYGGTSSPREISAYRIETLVEDVACLIAASGMREVLLLSHDWGAVLAWALAIWQPRLINRLVVLNLPHPACFIREFKRPAQFMRSWYMLLFQLPILPEFLLGCGQGRGIAELFRRTASSTVHFPDEVMQVYRANALRPGGLTAMLNWYRALLRGGGMRRLGNSSVAKIDIPTLFIWGGADAGLSIRTTYGTEDYVSDLTFRVLPGISHWVQQEAPHVVNAMLESWLSGRRVPEYSELLVAANFTTSVDQENRARMDRNDGH